MSLEHSPVRQTGASAGHEFLTTDEAARLLRLAPRTLERFRLEGTGPKFRKLGRRCLYSYHDLLAWTDSRVRQSTSEAA